MSGVARVRIGRVTPKSSSVQLLFLPPDPDRRHIEEQVRGALDVQGNGHHHAFAFVVWDREGASVTRFAAQDGSPIPTALIPDFVRNLLLAARIETWTLETLRDQP